MTLKAFAKAVGVGEAFIKRRMEDGSLPYTVEKRNGRGCVYNIDPDLVLVWKEKTKNRNQSPTSTIKKQDKREYLSKNTPLRQATAILEQLKSQGIYVSYGEAEARGLFAGGIK